MSAMAPARDQATQATVCAAGAGQGRVWGGVGEATGHFKLRDGGTATAAKGLTTSARGCARALCFFVSRLRPVILKAFRELVLSPHHHRLYSGPPRWRFLNCSEYLLCQ